MEMIFAILLGLLPVWLWLLATVFNALFGVIPKKPGRPVKPQPPTNNDWS